MAKAPTAESAQPDEVTVECGIIMPIADMSDYTASHWEAMLELISRGVRKAGMTPQPVWANGPADVLQERIVRNLYEQPFAVCDVSGLNPNVMLELGIRLAFGKPTIIVNDGVTRAPFDIGPAEYVAYDRSLHYKAAEDFVERLKTRIQAVKAVVDQNTYRPYIKTFGPIELGAPGNEAVPLGEVVLDQLEMIKSEMRQMRNFTSAPVRDALAAYELPPSRIFPISETTLTFPVSRGAMEEVRRLLVMTFPNASIASFRDTVTVNVHSNASPAMTKKLESEILSVINEVEERIRQGG